jgi:hypothetical protein
MIVYVCVIRIYNAHHPSPRIAGLAQKMSKTIADTWRWLRGRGEDYLKGFPFPLLIRLSDTRPISMLHGTDQNRSAYLVIVSFRE